MVQISEKYKTRKKELKEVQCIHSNLVISPGADMTGNYPTDIR